MNMKKRFYKQSFMVLPFLLALLLLISTTQRVLASTVMVDDQAHVLDSGQIRTEGAKLSKSLLVYTTSNFHGDLDALNQDARQRLPDQQTVVIAIDTEHRNVSVQAGTSVKLSDDQGADAVKAFTDHFASGGYTGATVAAIDSVQTSLSGGNLDGLFTVGIVILVFFFFVMVGRKGNRGSNYHSYTGSSSGDSGGSSGGSDFGGGAGGHF